MYCRNIASRHCRSLAATAAALWAASLFSCVAARADEATDIVRVEEEWELVVTEPDYDSNSPQATTLLSPGGDTSGYYVNFEINHGSQPEYVAGGLQLQLWNGETHVASDKNENHHIMSTPNETVRWRQCMAATGAVLSFEINNGTSATWGNFGGTGQLKTQVQAGLHDLNHYSPDVSVRNSAVGFAGNRVQSLKLKSVRVTLRNGQSVDDNTVHTVWEHTED